MAELVRFRIRRDTAANWSSVNPVLKLGEPALETDTLKVKYGDGVTAWNALPYASVTATGTKAQFDTALTDGDFVFVGDTPTSLILTNATGLPTNGLVDDAVTFAKIQNATAASKLVGRGSAAGSGDFEEIALGANISMNGTTVSALAGTTYTLSTVTSADIPIPAGTARTEMDFYLTFSADGALLDGLLTTDGFATVKTGATDYNSVRATHTGSAASVATTTALALMRLLNGVGNATGEYANGRITIHTPSNAACFTTLICQAMRLTTVGAPAQDTDAATYLTANTVNGIRLQPNAVPGGTMTGKIFVRHFAE